MWIEYCWYLARIQWSGLSEFGLYLLKKRHAKVTDIFEWQHKLVDFLLRWYGTITVIAVILITFYIWQFGIRLIGTIASGRDTLFTNFAYIDEWEEELGSLDDVILYAVTYISVILWFFFFTLVTHFVVLQHVNWIITIFIAITISGIIIPGSLLKDIGIHSVQYIRGSSRTTLLAFESLLDFLAISVIMIRFFIQNIRFVFIFLAFFELYEFLIHTIDTLADYVTIEDLHNVHTVKPFSQGKIILTYFFGLITYFIQYFYYLGHLTLLFIIQLSIYFALSFWLFLSLYSTCLAVFGETYFKIKRNARV